VLSELQGPLLIEFDRIARGIAREVAANRGAELIDAARLFSSHLEPLFAGASHCTDAGALTLADTVAKEIVATIASKRCSPSTAN